jgi:hypothetical protein
MTVSTSGIAMSYERIGMLNIGTKNASGGYDASGSNFALMGKGFEKIDESTNPNVDEKTYVNDVSSTKTVTGYAPEWAFSGDVIKDNAVITFLRNIGKTQKSGSDATAEFLLYDLWAVDASGSVVAQKYNCTVQVDDAGSIEGGSTLTFSGSILGNGSPVQGTFATSTKIFTPTA